MSEIEPVKVVSDTGHKKRWGISNFYRQDGKKLTLQGKLIGWILGVGFLVTSAFILINGPTHMELKYPIVFNGTVSNVATIEVPPAAEPNLDPKARNKGTGQSVQHFSGLEVVSRPRLGKIPPGTSVNAKFTAGASNGLVRAVLTETLSANGDGIADTGTVLIGNGNSTEERLMVQFNKMVFRDGTVQNIKAQACDKEDQMIGIKGSKVSKYATMLAAGIGLNFAGGLADGLQETEVQNGVAVKKSDLRNAALNGAAKASIETSKEILEKWKQQKTVIEVKEGTEICVIFDGE